MIIHISDHKHRYTTTVIKHKSRSPKHSSIIADHQLELSALSTLAFSLNDALDIRVMLVDPVLDENHLS